MKNKYGFIFSDEAMNNEEITPQTIAIYCYLCFCSGNRDYCQISNQTIARHTGIKNRKTVTKHIRILEQSKFIEVKRKRDDNGEHRINIYRILKR